LPGKASGAWHFQHAAGGITIQRTLSQVTPQLIEKSEMTGGAELA
jgi:hypothetical protein